MRSAMNALREVRASLFESTTAPTRMTAGEFNGLKWAPKASFTPRPRHRRICPWTQLNFPLHDGHEFARPSARRGRTMTGWPRLMRVLGLSASPQRRAWRWLQRFVYRVLLATIPRLRAARPLSILAAMGLCSPLACGRYLFDDVLAFWQLLIVVGEAVVDGCGCHRGMPHRNADLI